MAKEGSLKRAAGKLHVSQPSISAQVSELEAVLGEKLFRRRGRSKVLTDAGQVAYRYADEIFSLGQEFQDTLKGRSTGKPLRLVVGVSDVIAKSIVHRILEPLGASLPHPLSTIDHQLSTASSSSLSAP